VVFSPLPRCPRWPLAPTRRRRPPVAAPPRPFLTHDYLATSERHGWRFIQSEVLDIDRSAKRALHQFKGGEWVMTLPPPPQRCPPSPYERACLVAWCSRRTRSRGHITILDHKDGVPAT
jgi:hypothetical protein